MQRQEERRKKGRKEKESKWKREEVCVCVCWGGGGGYNPPSPPRRLICPRAGTLPVSAASARDQRADDGTADGEVGTCLIYPPPSLSSRAASRKTAPVMIYHLCHTSPAISLAGYRAATTAPSTILPPPPPKKKGWVGNLMLYPQSTSTVISEGGGGGGGGGGERSRTRKLNTQGY